jgi:predicted secreted Zn-dependent protease
MPTKREIDSEVARLIDAHAASMERYRRAWGNLDLVPAARDMEQTLQSLQEFAREHAQMYNTYPP